MIPLPIEAPSTQTGLGNSDMGVFPKDNTAMNILNAPDTKRTFNLSGVPQVAKLNRSIGDISWKTGETWAILLGGVAVGFIGRALFDKLTR